MTLTQQEEALLEEALRPYGIPMETCRPVRCLAGGGLVRQG